MYLISRLHFASSGTIVLGSHALARLSASSAIKSSLSLIKLPASNALPVEVANLPWSKVKLSVTPPAAGPVAVIVARAFTNSVSLALPNLN